MNNSFLDFEKPIADIHDKIQALREIVNESPELLPQIAKLEEEEKLITKKSIPSFRYGKLFRLLGIQKDHIQVITFIEYFQILMNCMEIECLGMIHLL